MRYKKIAISLFRLALTTRGYAGFLAQLRLPGLTALLTETLVRVWQTEDMVSSPRFYWPFRVRIARLLRRSAPRLDIRRKSASRYTLTSFYASRVQALTLSDWCACLGHNSSVPRAHAATHAELGLASWVTYLFTMPTDPSPLPSPLSPLPPSPFPSLFNSGIGQRAPQVSDVHRNALLLSLTLFWRGRTSGGTPRLSLRMGVGP